jgi:hypothetical protein
MLALATGFKTFHASWRRSRGDYGQYFHFGWIFVANAGMLSGGPSYGLRSSVREFISYEAADSGLCFWIPYFMMRYIRVLRVMPK